MGQAALYLPAAWPTRAAAVKRGRRRLAILGSEIKRRGFARDGRDRRRLSAGRVLSREQILDALKGHAEAFDRSIDVHIAKIRAKLEPDPKEPRFIKTVRGVGYLLARTPD